MGDLAFGPLGPLGRVMVVLWVWCHGDVAVAAGKRREGGVRCVLRAGLGKKGVAYVLLVQVMRSKWSKDDGSQTEPKTRPFAACRP